MRSQKTSEKLAARQPLPFYVLQRRLILVSLTVAATQILLFWGHRLPVISLVATQIANFQQLAAAFTGDWFLRCYFLLPCVMVTLLIVQFIAQVIARFSAEQVSQEFAEQVSQDKGQARMQSPVEPPGAGAKPDANGISRGLQGFNPVNAALLFANAVLALHAGVCLLVLLRG